MIKHDRPKKLEYDRYDNVYGLYSSNAREKRCVPIVQYPLIKGKGVSPDIVNE